MKESFKIVTYPRQAKPDTDLSAFSLEQARKARDFHASFDVYAQTPLTALPGLAKALGVASIHVKDESYRFGLNAFKVLGGSYALGRYIAKRLGEERTAKGLHPVELRLDQRAAALIPGTPAGPQDFDTEFLDYILAVKVVDSVEEAIGHIAEHSTGHSEAILTQNEAHASLFTAAVDSAAVYVNCSTRFTDGGEFGLGCEMGISTQKLHARGPMGLQELCSYKYVIHGDGQIR